MDQEYVFISIMGTQIMGTLQSYLAFQNYINAPVPVKIYYNTSGDVKSYSERACKFITEDKKGICELEEIGIKPENKNYAPPIIAKFVETATQAGKRVCFNMDGSLNYLISATTLTIAQYEPLYITTNETRAILYDSKSGQFTQLLLPEKMNLEQILALQGLNIEKCNEPPSTHFNDLLKRKKITLPDGGRLNVKVADMKIDYLCNLPNNRLCFVKELGSERDACNNPRSSGYYKDRDRDFCNWCKDRSRCGQVYDKNIHALVSHEDTEERITSATQGKVEIINFSAQDDKNPSSEKEKLEKIHAAVNPKVHKVKNRVLEPKEAHSFEPMRDNTLVTCMGTELATTLNAIATHKPKHLLLCYTSKKQPVEGYAERVKKFAKELCLESVTLVPIDLEGTFLEQKLPQAEPGAKVAVNITPGTKSQCVMLTLWAKEHGYNLYSLDNQQKIAAPLLGTDVTKAFKLVSPELFFKILNQECSFTLYEDMLKTAPWLKPFYQFVQEASKIGRLKDIINRDVHKVAIGKYKLIHECCGKWNFWDGDKKYTINTKDGAWFEQLCAYALVREGGKKVILNPKQNWSPQIAARIKKKYDNDPCNPAKDPHKLELDVVGIFGSNYVLVSCKSDPYICYDKKQEYTQEERDEKLNAAAKEAKNVAVNLGRFTLAILAHRSTPDKIEEGQAKMVDWSLICEPGKLKDILEELSKSKSSTRSN